MKATQPAPHIAIVRYGSYGCLSGWVFFFGGREPEPCPAEVFDLGPLLENADRVCRTLAVEGQLLAVALVNPRAPEWTYVWSSVAGQGRWVSSNWKMVDADRIRSIASIIEEHTSQSAPAA